MDITNKINTLTSATPMAEILKICDLSLPENPRGTDKGSLKSYVKKYYEIKFAKLRDKKIRVLEIGFRHGASLALWSHYFSDAEIIGLDNGSDIGVTSTEPVNMNWLSLPNITPIYGDAYDPHFTSGINGEFDIIIDDGPHSLSSQLKFIKLYYPKLAKHGIMVIEDIQRFGGLTIWAFLLQTPFNCEVKFYDFRMQSGVPDDILYVIKKTDKKNFNSRFVLLIRALFYVIYEPLRFLMRLIYQATKNNK